MSNKLEDIRKCLGKPITRKFKDEDGGEMEFEFYPLGIDSLPDFMELQQKLAGDPNNVLKRENSELMIKLITNMLKKSFPENTPKDVMDAFAMRHLATLQEVLIETNVPKDAREANTDKIKARLKQAQDAKAATDKK